MSTPVVMPQMGESIAEGTIVRWIKKVGDNVDRDEPLFEISTDKVDAEIPSPAAGVLLDIAVKEGETVPVNSVVATIGAAGETGRRAPPPRRRRRGSRARRPDRRCPRPPSASPRRRRPATPAPPRRGRRRAAAAAHAGNGRPQRSSPLVRRIAKEHGVDIGRISGTGAGGRVTKHDILEHMENGPAAAAAAAPDGGVGADGGAARPGPGVPARRAGRDPADVGDAQEDRRAHGAQQAHLGARLLGVRGDLLARRGAAQGAQGRLRAAGRQADLHVVHRQGGRRHAAPASGDQRLDRRRQRRLQEGRQPRASPSRSTTG